MKKNVYFTQVLDTFGSTPTIRLPLATGYIWSYAINDDIINQNYKLGEIFLIKEPISNILERIDNPSILGLSCYMWNWEYNMSLAKIVKETYPDCLIVIGGPHVPASDNQFHQKHPYINILVHDEGEKIFHNIITAHHNNSGYRNIKGTSINIAGLTVFQGAETRIIDLMTIPSPYLNGVFDKIVEQYKDTVELTATTEHTRGCPYKCTFCDIGANYYTKVDKFSLERSFLEFDRIAKDYQLEYISNSDSNFGMFSDDVLISKHLSNLNKEYGFPTAFRTDWAKNKNKKVLESILILEERHLSRGITLSAQSLNADVLSVIKRNNISIENNLIIEYNKLNINTYSELILGLPLETYDSFVSGYTDLIESGQHNSVEVYPCMVLPNSEYDDPAFIEKYNYMTVTAPQINFFAEVSTNKIVEYEKYVIETNTMSFDDMVEAHLFYAVTTVGHFHGFTHILSRFIRRYSNISYKEFYLELIKWGKNNPDTLFGSELNITYNMILSSRKGDAPRYRILHNVIWDFQNALGMQLIKDLEQLYKEIIDFIRIYISDSELLLDLMKFQKEFIIKEDVTYPIVSESKYNFFEYIVNGKSLECGEYTYDVNSYGTQYQHHMDYINEMFWYKRRVGGCRVKIRPSK